MAPKIIELALCKDFNTLFFACVCFMYILFIAMPVAPMVNIHIPINPSIAITSPIKAARIGRKNGRKIKKPTIPHPLYI